MVAAIGADDGGAAMSNTGIPFLITQKMRADLSALGFTDDKISHMTPEEAWQHLNAAGGSTKPMT